MAAPSAAVTAVSGYESFLVGEVAMSYLYPIALFQGRSETTLTVALPRNALVDEWKLLVQARRVDSTLLQQVAQVRAYDTTTSHELVVDFGTARTVSGISLPGGAQVNMVFAWLGTQFSPTAAFAATATSNALFTEVRTERLRVVISRQLNGDELAAVSLRLPEPPSGLTISIDGGQPVYQHPEPVQPRGDVSTPDEAGWDKDSRRIVPLTAALAALAANPLGDEAPASFQLTLRTAVPCELSLATSGTPKLRRIRRLRFGGETSTRSDFDSEGRIDLPIDLPSPPGPGLRRIDEVRWIAEADLAAERVLPPLGPDAAQASGTPVLAELLVDSGRAVAVRLPPGSGLATLTALRLPLAVDGDGAEVRVVLWSADPVGGAPLAALPQGASEPVTLAAAAAYAPEAWVRFDFAQPQPLADATLPWMVLVVARGSARWALASASATPADPLNAQLPRRGPPTGPFKALPQPLQDAVGPINARARLRLVGLPPKAAPMAPLELQLDASPAVAVTPTAKGAAGTLAPAGGIASAAPQLRLTSRVAGSVTWRDIDVVSDV
ncbi:conserved hypothetical protein [Rubrivivax sp. A210]|uniref:hypothetical protein n=1 Tax=Rubrivivax sp. A210 TaxID=2772301 RepID=UPI0019195A9E|nr:hypothetical protein [Rubrivivax sp. A210]CAD5366020.1 conserved hypothetical protein [Rubrivivax sp. A210]